MRSPTHRTSGTPRLFESLLEKLDSSAAGLIRSRMVMIQTQLAKLGGETKPNWPVIAYNIRLMVEAWLKAAVSEGLEMPSKRDLLEMFTSVAVGPYEKPTLSPVRAPKASLDGRKKKKKRKAKDAKNTGSRRPKRAAEAVDAERRPPADIAREAVEEAINASIRGREARAGSHKDEHSSPQRGELPSQHRPCEALSGDRGSRKGRRSGEGLGLHVQLPSSDARSQDAFANSDIRTRQTLESVGA